MLAAGAILPGPLESADPDRPVTDEALALFERKIRPVLVEHCYECHSETSKELGGGLRLDRRSGWQRGGDSGPAIVPGSPQESLLLTALRYDDLQMPPQGKLPPSVVRDFTQWIKIGAPDPRNDEANVAKSDDLHGSEQDTREAVHSPSNPIARAEDLWSLHAPQPSRLPDVQNVSWPQRRTDFYILSRLQQVGLQPAEPASDHHLVRRTYFDLVGLPPTWQQLRDFQADQRPDRYERLVDQLLASPRFGEHWARLWLDLARFAEDQAHIVGNNKSLFYPNAFLYRDWVIAQWNQDLPYDRFVQLQLAADLIDADDREDWPALGFLGLGPKYYDRGRLEVQAEEWEDRVDTVCRTLIGMTVACARCHDHKFDPIGSDDYYAIAGVFASSPLYNCPLGVAGDNGVGSRRADSPAESMHIVRDGKPRDLPVFIRGDVQKPGPVVPRGLPARLSATGRPVTVRAGSGRRELAEALTDPRHPLTARVFVNRVWDRLIGQGIVSTTSNFGSQGEAPSHPHLLDDLALRFVRNGWSLKWLVREIVGSATYQQTSVGLRGADEIDPENRWLSHMNRKRLSIECWRDQLLAVSGDLSPRITGSSIDPSDPAETRRTVYAQVSRFQLHPMLALFDFPDPNVHASRRVATTTPLQKLFVMNHPFMVARAARLIDSLDLVGGSLEVEPALRSIYRRLFTRDPDAEEVAMCAAFLDPSGNPRLGERERWLALVQALMASNELLYLD